MIADLTYQNHGVYWEAGYAEGLDIPVIYTCEESHFDCIHFDMKPSLTIKWTLELYLQLSFTKSSEGA